MRMKRESRIVELTNFNQAGITRRDFVKVAAAGTFTVATAGPLFAAAGADAKQGEMIYRTLGSTREKVSALGLGGFHFAEPKDVQESIRILRSAVDRGITFMDNC